MNLGVIGTGYVGLVAGTCFAEMGNRVLCCDVDERKIARLREGEVPIYEPGLEDLIARNAAEGRIAFTTDIGATVRESEILFIAVGTPPGEDGSADLRHVEAVAREIARHANGPRIVVNKSTVPVGTGARVARILEESCGHPCAVVSNPEFLKEGAAIDDFMKPDRVVLGSDDPRALRVLEELYAPFVRTGRPILTMDLRSAEMTKYAANAMLAARITLMNEIANLCDLVGADVDKVRQGVGSPTRGSAPRSCSRDSATAGRASPRTCGRSSSSAPRWATTRACSTPCTTSTSGRSGGWSRRSGPSSTGWRGCASRCGASRSSPRPTTCARRPPSS
jgi:UDPglucose 6-dehydrogenase